MNWIGLAAGLTAFLSIWLGHVAVRKIEAASRTIWRPALGAVVLGIALEAISLATASLPLSTILGIAGITLMWDALEFWRQQKRIINGHAPANPSNPRHARLLALFPAATTVDLLKREPTGCSAENIKP